MAAAPSNGGGATPPPTYGFARLRESGALLEEIVRGGKTVLRLKCSSCGKEFERPFAGGLSARLQENVYCDRRCAVAGNKAQLRRNGGDSQMMRFSRYREPMI
jgi:hypothetical protein